MLYAVLKISRLWWPQVPANVALNNNHKRTMSGSTGKELKSVSTLKTLLHQYSRLSRSKTEHRGDGLEVRQFALFMLEHSIDRPNCLSANRLFVLNVVVFVCFLFHIFKTEKASLACLQGFTRISDDKLGVCWLLFHDYLSMCTWQPREKMVWP